LPGELGKVPVDYCYASEVPPFDIQLFELYLEIQSLTTHHLQSPDRILRPGIIVSSTNEQHPLTTGTAHRRATSSITAVDKFGEPFITVLTYLVPVVGGEIYHPTPNGG